ncbi:MAG: hypothetical protein ACLSUW_04330 [Akkermansia sp.]
MGCALCVAGVVQWWKCRPSVSLPVWPLFPLRYFFIRCAAWPPERKSAILGLFSIVTIGGRCAMVGAVVDAWGVQTTIVWREGWKPCFPFGC